MMMMIMTNHILHNDKTHQIYSSRVVQVCAKQIQDDKRPPFWK